MILSILFFFMTTFQRENLDPKKVELAINCGAKMDSKSSGNFVY